MNTTITFRFYSRTLDLQITSSADNNKTSAQILNVTQNSANFQTNLNFNRDSNRHIQSFSFLK